MANFTFTVEIVTHFSHTLRKLQKVYPSCEIINQLLGLFEILHFYESSLDKEIQSVIADSSLSILKELISIAKTLEPYLEPEIEYFSDEDRRKIKEILNFDHERALDILDK